MNVRRRSGRITVLAVAASTLVLATSMYQAFAADEGAAVDLTVIAEDTISIVGTHFPITEETVIVTATFGTATPEEQEVDIEADGRFAAIVLAPMNFNGDAVIKAVAGDISKSKTIKAGTGVTPTTPPTTPGATTPPTTPGVTAPPTTAPVGQTGGKRGKFPSTRSGLTWASGVWDALEPESYTAMRGRAPDVAVHFVGRENWSTFGNMGPVTNKPYAISLSIPMLPEGGTNFDTCVSGGYNGQWTTIANNIKAAGLDVPGKTALRLNWEFQIAGKGQGNRDFSAPQFVGCWKQVHKVVHAIAPNVYFDWNPNRGPSQTGTPTTEYWPGDEYVDIVGIDTYDWFGTWDQQLNGNEGLNYWLDFTKKHNKLMSFPEWGMYAGTSGEAHDNDDAGGVTYVTGMFNFFKTNAEWMSYETEFYETNSYCICNLPNNSKRPQASAKYIELWKKG